MSGHGAPKMGKHHDGKGAKEKRAHYWASHEKPQRTKSTPGVVRTKGHGRELASLASSVERVEKVKLLKDSKMLAMFLPGARGHLASKVRTINTVAKWPLIPWFTVALNHRGAFEVMSRHV